MERKVSLVVEGRGKGLTQTQTEITKFGAAASKAVADQNKGFELLMRQGQRYGTFWQKFRAAAGFPKMSAEAAIFQKNVISLKQRLADLAKQQNATLNELEKVKKGSDAYNEFADNLKRVQNQIRNTRFELKSLNQEHRKEAGEIVRYQQAVILSRGAFLQGLLQGAVPGGNLIQRGPGALQQAAGAAIGGAARGMLYERPKTILGGMAQTPFQGMQGLATAAQGIPLIGGVLAGQLQATAGFAGMALQRQTALRELLPQIGMEKGFFTQRATAGQIEAARAAAGRQTVSNKGMSIQERAARLSAPGLQLMPQSETTIAHMPAEAGGPTPRGLTQGEAERQAVLEFSREAEGVRKGRMAAAEKATKAKFYRGGIEEVIRGAGRQYAGMNAIESLQAAGAISQAGGGTFAEMRRQGMIQTGFAAQTGYGVGPEVSGAFLRGARRGGIAGMGGMNAAEAMTKSLSDAVEMGLRGSEVPEYMQIMAAGIQQFQQTGMPINPVSIGDMSRAASGMGLGATRGFAVGAAVSGAAQGLAGRGMIQSPMDILAMQTLGGFKGGGVGGYVKSMTQLEQGGFGGEQMTDFFRKIVQASGGGELGQLGLRQALSGWGVKMGWQESGMVQRHLEGTATPEDTAKLQQILAERVKGMQGPEDLLGNVAELMKEAAPALQRQAAIQNKQLAAGEQMLTAAQNMESATANVNNTFTKNIGPTITKLTEKVEQITVELPALIDAMRDWVRKHSIGFD